MSRFLPTHVCSLPLLACSRCLTLAHLVSPVPHNASHSSCSDARLPEQQQQQQHGGGGNMITVTLRKPDVDKAVKDARLPDTFRVSQCHPAAPKQLQLELGSCTY